MICRINIVCFLFRRSHHYTPIYWSSFPSDLLKAYPASNESSDRTDCDGAKDSGYNATATIEGSNAQTDGNREKDGGEEVFFFFFF